MTDDEVNKLKKLLYDHIFCCKKIFRELHTGKLTDKQVSKLKQLCKDYRSWSKIYRHFPGRTQHCVKNKVLNSRLHYKI
jgi:hypothetical protein